MESARCRVVSGRHVKTKWGEHRLTPARAHGAKDNLLVAQDEDDTAGCGSVASQGVSLAPAAPIARAVLGGGD